MRLLKGKKIADLILSDIRKKIKNRKSKPTLAVILIGENKVSELYVGLKRKAAKKAGISFRVFRYSSGEKEKKIIKKIKELNENKRVDGIIVQLPLPNKLNAQKIINAIDPAKDADGFHPQNIKLFSKNKELIWPVFPCAIMKLIESSRIKLQRKKAIVIANSKSFGKVMTDTLKRKKIKADYILAKNLKKNIRKIKKADITVVAVGRTGIIKKEMVKKGATVIDGGITKRGKKTIGDVDRGVRKIAGFVSPVPGGVGPMTIVCLLENVLKLAKLQKKC